MADTISAMPDAQPAEPARGSFLGNTNVVFFTYAVDGLLALATGALVARALEPDGRGAYALFVLSAALGQMVLGLGIGNAAIYYINKRQMTLRQVVSAVHVAVLWTVAASALVVLAIAPWAGAQTFGEGIPIWLFVVSVPLLLYMNLLRLLLQAVSRFVDLGITTIGQQSLLLGFVAVMFATGEATRGRVVLALALASGAAALYALLRLGVRNVDVAQIVRPRWDVIRRLARFGVQGESGNILQVLNYRLDQYIVTAFVGLSGVGIYAVGVSMTEAIFVLANSVALVLLPRLTAAAPEEVAWMVPLACRNTLLIAAGGAVALAAIAPVLIPAVFGQAFRDSVDALWLLLPGTVALAGSKVLTSYIFSQGRPLVNTGITVVSLVVTIGADLALIPVFGVNGAAAASSLAYGAHFAAALFAYWRMSGRSPLEAVLPRPADARLYVDGARNVLARVSGGAAVDAERSGTADGA
jgi:stage V sporulation protein B